MPEIYPFDVLLEQLFMHGNEIQVRNIELSVLQEQSLYSYFK